MIEPGLRGSTWRGRDCNDFEAHNYPGKIEDETIKTIDQNCNGIYMKNNIVSSFLYYSLTSRIMSSSYVPVLASLEPLYSVIVQVPISTFLETG